MLTTESYLIAMAVYWAAALIGLPLMRRLWFAKPMTRAGGAVLGLLAGVLLAPAFPGPDVSSMLFNTLFGEGFESALSAAMWLSAASLAGMIIGLLLTGRRSK